MGRLSFLDKNVPEHIAIPIVVYQGYLLFTQNLTHPMASVAPHSQCLIETLPYDVLRGIFIHYVSAFLPPRNDNRAAKNAPITLSHVCSSWRNVTETTPILWRHLSYTFILLDEGAESGVHRFVILKRDLDFIRWWKEKQGAIHPFITARVSIPRQSTVSRDEFADHGAFEFILDYLMSAQYLDISSVFWDQIGDRKCPNLHTLLLCGKVHPLDITFVKTQAAISVSPSPQRRLYLSNGVFAQDSVIPSQPLSSLTHIVLEKVEIPLTIFYDLYQATPGLQWAYFDISPTERRHRNETKLTLTQLNTLIIISTCRAEYFFHNLHLPALETLSISSAVYDTWQEVTAILQIQWITRATPNLTTLALGERFVSLDTENEIFYLLAVPQFTDVQPIWINAPRLSHIQLDTPFFRSETTEPTSDKRIVRFFGRLARPLRNKWLGLDNSDCPIRTVTVVSPELEKVQDIALSVFREQDIRFDLEFSKISVAEEAWHAFNAWGSSF
ncbi:hypothetical protein BDN70DRAFT_925342 [Pholiota conissans]|uniref:F-box domain-containing protein n=1 Tax=Pholiota conissans TaxID=109636 RepID=A0A9P5YSV8_9AGAR|nr:hypothetical protein BDN70DRAFT_925342 [Pholiota conissans]